MPPSPPSATRTPGAGTPGAPGHGDQPPGGRRGAGTVAKRTIITVIVLGSLILWIYAFSGAAERDPPNTLDDDGFPAAAEPICARAVEDLAELPRAETSRSAAERADNLDRGSAILTGMVDELDQLDRGGARDTEMLTEWLGDWETYIDDREAFADRLRTDEGARFWVTEKQPSFQITKAIDDLAKVNDMPSCATTADVG